MTVLLLLVQEFLLVNSPIKAILNWFSVTCNWKFLLINMLLIPLKTDSSRAETCLNLHLWWCPRFKEKLIKKHIKKRITIYRLPHTAQLALPSASLTRAGHLLQLINVHWHIIMIQIPTFTLGFTLSVAYSMGFIVFSVWFLSLSYMHLRLLHVFS